MDDNIRNLLLQLHGDNIFFMLYIFIYVYMFCYICLYVYIFLLYTFLLFFVYILSTNRRKVRLSGLFSDWLKKIQRLYIYIYIYMFLLFIILFFCFFIHVCLYFFIYITHIYIMCNNDSFLLFSWNLEKK
jgi:hypothetical protein